MAERSGDDEGERLTKRTKTKKLQSDSASASRDSQPVGPLSESETVELVRHHAESSGAPTPSAEDERWIRELGREVGHLPLAVVQVSVLVHHSRGQETYRSVLESVRRDAKAALDRGEQLDPSYNGNMSVWAVLRRSFDRLSPAARSVLCAMSLMAPDRIPWRLACRVSSSSSCRSPPSGARPQRPKAKKNKESEKEAAESARAELDAAGLLSWSRGGLVSVHRLVQAQARSLLGEPERRLLLGRCIDELEAATEEYDDQDASTWGAVRAVAPHVECVAALSMAEGDGGGGRDDLAVLWRVADCAWEADQDGERSLRLHRLILEAQKARQGADSEEVADSLNNMAIVRKQLGEPSEALQLFRESLKIFQAAAGDHRSQVAGVQNNIGDVLDAQGHLAEALQCYSEALDIYRAVLDKQDPLVAGVLNNMAAAYLKQGDLSKALVYFGEALDIKRAALGDEDPDVASTLNNMAIVYQQQGDRPKALQYFGEALEIKRAVLGDQHPSVAGTLHNMAAMFLQQGDLAKALLYFEEALDIRRAALGDLHPDVGETLFNMALLREQQGSFGVARGLFERALAAYEATYGPNHPEVVDCRDRIARLAGR